MVYYGILDCWYVYNLCNCFFSSSNWSLTGLLWLVDPVDPVINGITHQSGVEMGDDSSFLFFGERSFGLGLEYSHQFCIFVGGMLMNFCWTFILQNIWCDPTNGWEWHHGHPQRNPSGATLHTLGRLLHDPSLRKQSDDPGTSWEHHVWINHNDLTSRPKPGIMVNQGNDPLMALIQVSEL